MRTLVWPTTVTLVGNDDGYEEESALQNDEDCRTCGSGSLLVLTGSKHAN